MSSRRNKELQIRIDMFVNEIQKLEKKYNLLLVSCDEQKIVMEDYDHYILRLATKEALDNISSADITKSNL